MFHSDEDKKYQMEKYSSAFSLADMEIFVFPELLFSLVLANIMSPVIWRWREDPWFAKVNQMNPYRRVLRLKQFIIENYEFNLDLDTWGLTTKDREMDRFKDFIDMDVLSRSNALFGYEGDKYYFNLDIRRHFGLDKYTSNIIPYWKTETVEAMDAFRNKEGYRVGAGECVSLSTLYAAALYVVCEIPLEDIYLLATPLHSQNFVNINEGLITNNRRIVTKRMLFNGTELSNKAQRALRNEHVTIVANHTGYVHTMYPEATIDRAAYEKGMKALRSYLRTDVDMGILANFLRDFSSLQKCFQIRHDYHGKARYIGAEKVYAYEHRSPYHVNDNTRDRLLAEIDEYAFYADPLPGRILLNKFEAFFAQQPLDLNKKEDLDRLFAEFNCTCASTYEIGKGLLEFIAIDPRLPHGGKTFIPSEPIPLEPGMSREAVVEHLDSLRERHPVADLAFYVFRDLTRIDWAPFLKAAIERNPVCIEAASPLGDDALIEQLQAWPNESIYEGPRLAQPDETWNFKRGDGAETILLLAHLLKARHPERSYTVAISPDEALLTGEGIKHALPSAKGLKNTFVV